MRTVQLLYIVLVISLVPEAESKVWILKLFQKAVNSIRGMKEGSAAASAVAVAAVGGGAVVDTIIDMTAEDKTPIAGAQKTLSDENIEASIVNATLNVNQTILSKEESEDTDMTVSNSNNTTSGRRTKPRTNTRLVEIEVPCDSKVSNGNKAKPTEGLPEETVGRHSHKWFEKFYGQNANKRVCKTFVEVPIFVSNTSSENDSNQHENPQTAEPEITLFKVDHDPNDTDQDIFGVKIQNSEFDYQNINAGVTQSYDDIYIRPIIKFNQDVQNSGNARKSYNNVYIRPIIKFNQDVTQPSQPNIVPEIPVNNVHTRPIMKLNRDVEVTSQPNTDPEIPEVNPEQPNVTDSIANEEDIVSKQMFINNLLNDSGANSNDSEETYQNDTNTTEFQVGSEQRQTSLGTPHAEDFESEQVSVNNILNASSANPNASEETQHTTEPHTGTLLASAEVKQADQDVPKESEETKNTSEPHTGTHLVSAEVSQSDQDVPKYSYMRNRRINGHDIEQEDYSSKENILFTPGVQVSQSLIPWMVIALAVLCGIFGMLVFSVWVKERNSKGCYSKKKSEERNTEKLEAPSHHLQAEETVIYMNEDCMLPLHKFIKKDKEIVL